MRRPGSRSSGQRAGATERPRRAEWELKVLRKFGATFGRARPSLLYFMLFGPQFGYNLCHAQTGGLPRAQIRPRHSRTARTVEKRVLDSLGRAVVLILLHLIPSQSSGLFQRATERLQEHSRNKSQNCLEFSCSAAVLTSRTLTTCLQVATVCSEPSALRAAHKHTEHTEHQSDKATKFAAQGQLSPRHAQPKRGWAWRPSARPPARSEQCAHRSRTSGRHMRANLRAGQLRAPLEWTTSRRGPRVCLGRPFFLQAPLCRRRKLEHRPRSWRAKGSLHGP